MPSWLEIGKRVATALTSELGVTKKLREYAYAVEVAKADPVEAAHGHYCGPGCYHVDLLAEPERAAYKKKMGWDEWPSLIMERYRKGQP